MFHIDNIEEIVHHWGWAVNERDQENFQRLLTEGKVLDEQIRNADHIGDIKRSDVNAVIEIDCHIAEIIGYGMNATWDEDCDDMEMLDVGMTLYHLGDWKSIKMIQSLAWRMAMAALESDNNNDEPDYGPFPSFHAVLSGAIAGATMMVATMIWEHQKRLNDKLWKLLGDPKQKQKV